MTARAVLDRLDDLGVRPRTADGRLLIRASEKLDDDLKADIGRHRDALIELLEERQHTVWSPTAGDASRGTVPLTRAQRAIVTLDRGKRDGRFNLHGAWRFHGSLNRERLRRALHDLGERHPVLRIRVREQGGVLVQHVVDERLRLDEIDLSGSNAPLSEAIEHATGMVAEHLDTSASPPVRVSLAHLDEDDHLLVFVVHHVIADATSLRILARDLFDAYQGRPVEAVDGFARLAALESWERVQERSGDFSRSRRHWDEQLAGAVASPPLPRSVPQLIPRATSAASSTQAAESGPGSADRSGEAAAEPVVRLRLSPELSRDVRRLAEAHHTSIFAVVATAVAALLERYTGVRDLVVTTPTERRHLEGLDHVVGPLLDLVPLRVAVSPYESFAHCLTRTRESIFAAAVIPLPPVGSASTRQRELSLTAPAVVITDAGRHTTVPELEGLHIVEVDLPQSGSKYQLNVVVEEDRESVLVACEHDPAVTGRDQVAAMLATLRAMLGDATADPERPICDLAREERSPTRSAVPAGPPDPVAAETLHGRIRQCATLTPEATAVISGDEIVTYQTLVADAEAVAAGLIDHGVRPGDVVAVCLHRDSRLVVALLGVMCAGATYLVIDENQPEARRVDAARRCRVRLVLGAEAVPGLPSVRPEELIARGHRPIPLPEVSALAPAYAIYTSGSTGTPKGVLVSHRNVTSLLDATAAPLGLGPADVWTLFHSCSFDFSVWELFGALTLGGTLVVVPTEATRDPAALAALLDRHRVTVLNQTPSALTAGLEAVAGVARRGHLRLVVLGGEQLDPGLPQRWYAAAGTTPLVNMYGITETTVHASWHLTDTSRDAESCIGTALPGGALLVLDPRGRPVSTHEVGEIYVGGPQVTDGYVADPVTTALRFVPDPFSSRPGSRLYRSGDLARQRDEDITYLGRADAQVQVNGFRVDLAEIDAALSTIPGVVAACSTVLRDRAGASIVVGVVSDGASLDVAEIRLASRFLLPPYAVPSAVVEMQRLPLTGNGKLDRAAVLRDLDRLRPDETAPSSPAAGSPLATILASAGETLHQEADADSNFFLLGGDSLRALQLVAALAERGIAIDVGDIYRSETLGDLATMAVLGPALDEGQAPFSLLATTASESLAPDVVDAYPMGLLQTGMIYHRELAEGSELYHIVLSYRLAGTLDPRALRDAVAALVARHPVLRTSFDLGAVEGPIQRVHTTLEADLRIEDLRGCSAEQIEQRVAQVVSDERHGDFPLERPGLFRLVALAFDDEWQLVFSHHHAIMDGWSVNVFFDDLRRGYAAAAAGGSPDLGSPDCCMALVAAREAQALGDREDQRFWSDLVTSCAPSVLGAGTGPGHPDMRQARWESDITGEDLRQVAGRVGCSVKSLLMAVHTRTLAWLLDADAVTTGLVVPTRPEVALADRAVGLFLNELPVPVTGVEGSWASLARSCAEAETRVMAHRWYPYAAIVEAHGGPLFDTSFNFTDFHLTRQALEDGDLVVNDVEEIESTHHTLGSNFTVDVRSGRLRLILEHDAAVITAEVASVITEAERRCLEALVADPNGSSMSVRMPSLFGPAILGRIAGSVEGAPLPDPAAASDTGDRPEPRLATQAVGEVDDLREVVAGQWSEVLGEEPEDTRDFFLQGGSSISAMKMVSRLRRHLGPITMAEFHASPTVPGLVAHYARGGPTSRKVPLIESVSASGSHRRPSTDRWPLTSAQHGIYDLARRMEGISLFGLPGAVELVGPFHVEVLTQALDDVVRRHAALRVRIEDDGAGDVVQRLSQPSPSAGWLQVTDVSAEADPVAACARLLRETAMAPVDFTRPPLLKAALCRLGEDRHVLYLDLHHIVGDAWSLDVLIQDVISRYIAHAGPDPAPPLPSAVGAPRLGADHADRVSRGELDHQRDYWIDELGGTAGSHLGRPGSVLRRLSGRTPMDRWRARRVRRTSALVLTDPSALPGSPFLVALTAWADVLLRWSASTEVRIGTMVANRLDPDTEQAVGLVANTVVLRIRRHSDDGAPRDTSALQEALASARSAYLGALDNQEYPFEKLVGSLADAGTAVGDLMEFMLVVAEEKVPSPDVADLSARPFAPGGSSFSLPVTPTQAALVLGVTYDADGLRLELQYKPAVMDETDAERLIDDVALTLRRVVDMDRETS